MKPTNKQKKSLSRRSIILEGISEDLDTLGGKLAWLANALDSKATTVELWNLKIQLGYAIGILEDIRNRELDELAPLLPEERDFPF